MQNKRKLRARQGDKIFINNDLTDEELDIHIQENQTKKNKEKGTGNIKMEC